MFPKFIPSLDTTVSTDESGLTEPQKVAIKSAWNVIKKNQTTHAKNFNVLFFEKYPEYIRGFYVIPPDNKNLHDHAIKSLHIFGALIEKGLDDKSLFDTIVNTAVTKHRPKGISKNDMQKMATVIKDYLQTALERQSTPTFQKALFAFFDKIVDAFDRTD